MKKIFSFVFAAAIAMTSFAQTKSIYITVKDTKYQTITGFGGACCDGAMRPLASETEPIRQLYGDNSITKFNILRMEISPNFKGNITAADIGWDTPYDWFGSVPSARIVKQRGGIVFGTPWSPPGEYKTNGSAQGGNADDQGNIRAELREDCYEKFFPWINSFLTYMRGMKVKMDAISIQNEPDWWVSYSGCLYSPQQQVKLVKNYAHLLDRENNPGLKLISAEPLGFSNDYHNALINDATCKDQIDIFAGHIYGHSPLQYIKPIADKVLKLGKEVWMTEHSSTDNIGDRLPNWQEQLLFADEVNECMISGCTGYIYWYLRAHWAFVGTGESKYGSQNVKNKLLPRAYVMSHFSKHLTGSTRLKATATGYSTPKTEDPFECSAYVKGDSLIVIAIDRTGYNYNLKLRLPYNVKSGTHILSTGNETENLCQESEIAIENEFNTTSNYIDVPISLPGNSLSTFVFMIDRGEDIIDNPSEEETAIANSKANKGKSIYYDMLGRRITEPKGMYIEKCADGTIRKVYSDGNE